MLRVKNAGGVFPTASVTMRMKGDRRCVSDGFNGEKPIISRRHEQAWFGGGAPDWTGDPRLDEPQAFTHDRLYLTANA